MSLTYLNAAMIEVPASIAELSAGNLKTTSLTGQSAQFHILTANSLIAPNIVSNTNVVGNLTVFGQITALSGFNVIVSNTSQTSSLQIINIGVGPALFINQSPTTQGIASLNSSGTEVVRVNSSVPDIAQAGVVINWPGIGPALLVPGVTQLSSLNAQIANITNLFSPNALVPSLTSNTVQAQNLVFPNAGGNIFNDTALFGNITIYGAISALSGITTTNTFTNTTSSLSVVNTGVGPALFVSQAAGPEGIASFVGGDSTKVLTVFNSVPNIGLPAVNIVGVLSATGGNSTNWNSVFTNVQSNSANWQGTFTNVQSNSGNWNTAYNIATTYQSVSAGFNQTLSVNTTAASLTITNGNTVSLTGIRGAVGGGADRVFYENDSVITTSYTITSGKNAMTAGPITVLSAATVTVPDGSTWTVI